MKKITKYAFVLSIFLIAAPVFAQDEAVATEQSSSVAESTVITQDEPITADSLGVAESTLLPNSRFYFLKNWRRGISYALTFNKIKKAELSARFANEKLLEAQKLAEKNSDASVLDNAIEGYRLETEKTKTLSDKINKDDPDASEFLDKLADFQFKRQRAIDRLSKQLPEQSRKKAIDAQERSLEQFGETMMKFDDPEKAMRRLEKAAERQKEKMGEFKHFEGDDPEHFDSFNNSEDEIGDDEFRQEEMLDMLEDDDLLEESDYIDDDISDDMNREDKIRFMERMQKDERPNGDVRRIEIDEKTEKKRGALPIGAGQFQQGGGSGGVDTNGINTRTKLPLPPRLESKRGAEVKVKDRLMTGSSTYTKIKRSFAPKEINSDAAKQSLPEQD